MLSADARQKASQGMDAVHEEVSKAHSCILAYKSSISGECKEIRLLLFFYHTSAREIEMGEFASTLLIIISCLLSKRSSSS